jgi:hypothetical protein
MRSFITCTLHQILLGLSMKKDETGGALGADGGYDICIQNFGRKA